MITIIPAMKNLTPANSISDAGFAVSTENNPYPILTHGNALPHSAEQSIASNAAIYVFLSVSAFIKTSYITKSSGIVTGRQYRFIF